VTYVAGQTESELVEAGQAGLDLEDKILRQ
jgi:hypothetical protein